jgi:hypothetical protein
VGCIAGFAGRQEIEPRARCARFSARQRPLVSVEVD